MVRVWTVLFTLIAATPALAEFIQGSDIDSGNWAGGAYTDDASGAFSHCAISAEYVSGDELFMSVNGDATVTVGVLSPAFNLAEGQTFAVTLQIDRRSPFYGSAYANGTNFATLVLPDLESALTALRRGRTLVLYSDWGSSSYDLTGTNRALNETLQCAIDYINYVGKSAPPAVTNTPPPQTSSITQDQLDQVAREMVAAFEIKDAAFYSREELQGYIAHQAAVFSSANSGILFGAMAAAAGPINSLKDTDAEDFVFLTSSCEGESSTATRSLNVPGFESREVRATCQSQAGRSDSILSKTRVGSDILYTFFVFDGSIPYSPEDQQGLSEQSAIFATSLVTGQPLTTAPATAPATGPGTPPRRTTGN
jgi:hypothetical protein